MSNLIPMNNFIKVSFFSDMSITAKTRHCQFPAMPRAALTGVIAKAMRQDEFFACYRETNGAVVALDKNGFCVTQ